MSKIKKTNSAKINILLIGIILVLTALNLSGCLQEEIELSKDKTTLDPVIYDTFIKMERKKPYDFVITLLPTTPLLSVSSILNAIKTFKEKKIDITKYRIIENPAS